MRTLTILLICTLGSTLLAEEDPTAGLTSRSAQKLAVGVENEAATLKGSDGLARRVDAETLELTLADGATARWQNEAKGDESVTYYYVGHLPEAHLFVLAIGFYEGSGWMVVDDRTARTAELYGPPLLSPGNQYLAAANIDLVAGFDANGIQIVRLTDEGPVVEYVLDGQDWGAGRCAMGNRRPPRFHQAHFAIDRFIRLRG